MICDYGSFRASIISILFSAQKRLKGFCSFKQTKETSDSHTNMTEVLPIRTKNHFTCFYDPRESEAYSNIECICEFKQNKKIGNDQEL